MTMPSNCLTTWNIIWIYWQKKCSLRPPAHQFSHFSQTWMASSHTSAYLALPACLQESYFLMLFHWLRCKRFQPDLRSHRMVRGWKEPLEGPSYLLKQVQSWLLRTMFRQLLVIAKDGASTTSLHNLGQLPSQWKSIFWCSEGTSCSSVYACCLCQWAPLKRAWFHLLCILPSGIYTES